ncbi:MAG: hypothetical protein WBV93_15660 [Anaerobacillus sp.]
MEKHLKNLRAKMLDTEAVTFDDCHKEIIRQKLHHTPSPQKRFWMYLQEKFPSYLTIAVLVLLLSGTGLFAASEMGLVPEFTTLQSEEQSITQEELYKDILNSVDQIENERDREKVRSIALTYLKNFDNWRVTETESSYRDLSAILVQGKVTEGYFEKTTFSLLIEPNTDLPLSFIIRNQESSIIEEYQLPIHTIAKQALINKGSRY